MSRRGHFTKPWWSRLRGPRYADGGAWIREDGLVVIPGVNSYQVLQPLWGISPVKQLRLREGFVYELVRDQRELWDHGYLHPIKVSPRRLGNILGAVDRKHSLNHLVQLAALGQLHTE